MNPPADLIILGSGTTAFAAAIEATELGARVLMVEQSQVGGTCVNWGCIPSKTLIHHAQQNYETVRGTAAGLNMSAGRPDCPRLMASKRRAVETVRREHYQSRLEEHPDIEVLRGHGRLISPRELQVGAKVLHFERLLIATGGIPRVVRIPGLTEIDYLTSYSALHLSCFPSSLLLIGGGVIAVEMGQMFARFGVDVTILERGDRLLKDFDPRLSALFRDILETEGMRLIFGAEVRRVYRDGARSAAVVEVEGEERILHAERLMFAVGTAPATEGIGLEKAGVATDQGGFIRADPHMRTTVEGIWAAGDVTGPPLIAPAGAREGEVAAWNMLRPDRPRSVDHRLTPMAVFVDPEFASVGLTSGEAAARGIEAAETFLELEHVPKSHVMGGRRGGVLLVAERSQGRLLGVQILAPRAADVIHEAALALRCNLCVHDLVDMVHVYPTISDGLRLAALTHMRHHRS